MGRAYETIKRAYDEGYNKAIDDFAERISKLCNEQSFRVNIGSGHFGAGYKADILTLSGLTEIICDVAEQLKERDDSND